MKQTPTEMVAEHIVQYYTPRSVRLRPRKRKVPKPRPRPQEDPRQLRLFG